MRRTRVLYPRACDLGWRIPLVLALFYAIWFPWIIRYVTHLLSPPPGDFGDPYADFLRVKLAIAGLVVSVLLFLVLCAWIRTQPAILDDCLLVRAGLTRASIPFTDILFVRIFATKQMDGHDRIRTVDVQTRDFRLYTIWRTQLASPERFRKVPTEDIADRVEIRNEVLDFGG